MTREPSEADPSADPARDPQALHPQAPDPRALLARLLDTDDAALDDHDLLERIADWQRLAAMVTARQLASVAEFARRPARVDRAGEDPAARAADHARLGEVAREYADEELAARLRISRLKAGRMCGLGTALVALPATRAALREGGIDEARAAVVADEVAALDRATAREVEARLAECAPGLSAPRLREKARRLVLAVDPAAANVRHRRAREDRRVWLTPLPDGMAEIAAVLTADDAVAVKTALGATARAWKRARERGDDRTMDQLMADAFVAPFRAALADGTLEGTNGTRLARHRGEAAQLQVTVAASTLLGLDDAPAQLAGYGPVTADLARELTPHAAMRRLLTDPRSGTVLDVGRTVYRPPAGLDRFVKSRAVRCTFPGCGWTAKACETDHVVPFPQGPTAESNLRPLCPRHHHVKHATGMHLAAGPDGATTWTMPTGHVHDVEPPAAGDPLRAGDDPFPASDLTADLLGSAGLDDESVTFLATVRPPPDDPDWADARWADTG